MPLPQHDRYMRAALEEAKAAFDAGEIPVGAVIVHDGEIIARGRNNREEAASPLGHAELRAIAAAAEALGDWRLTDCTLYVTLEPCAMCAGACINARLSGIVYGAADPAAGCMGSRINLPHLELGSVPWVLPGVLKDECSTLLSDFFVRRRQQN